MLILNTVIVQLKSALAKGRRALCGGNVAGHKMAARARNGGGWAGPAPREAGDAQRHGNKDVR